MTELERIWLHGCNNNCIFCFRRDNFRKIKSTEDIIKKIQRLEKETKINFAADEATIHPDFLKIVNEISKKNLKFDLISNGRMLSNKKFLKYLIDRGLSRLSISLHSSNEEHNNRITQSNGFKQTILGIKNCVEANIPLNINIVICSINKDDLLDTSRFIAEELKVKTLNFLHIIEFKSHLNIKDIMVDYETCKKKILEIVDYLETNNVEYVFEHFPLCVLKEKDLYKKILNSLDLNDIKINQLVSECKMCSKKKECIGVSKIYLDNFGTKEIRRFE